LWLGGPEWRAGLPGKRAKEEGAAKRRRPSVATEATVPIGAKGRNGKSEVPRHAFDATPGVIRRAERRLRKRLAGKGFHKCRKAGFGFTRRREGREG
jgi:hypothetical protein